jgi:hypothetical protein
MSKSRAAGCEINTRWIPRISLADAASRLSES